MQNTEAFSPVSRKIARGARSINIIITVVTILLALILLVWLGLNVKPAPFPGYPQASGTVETTPLPQNLPAPVERFYRKVYGDTLPVVSSAVVTGRATLRIMGITFPARFRFIHQAGRNYRHYIQATFFGFPIMRVNETYLNGKSRLELPFGTTEGEPKVDQAANLGLWAEALWFPSLFVTDPRVSWEAVDASTALLVVPFGTEKERFVVRFDPKTSLPHLLESLRYKGASDEAKTLWLNEALVWDMLAGRMLLTESALTWLGDGSPWARFRLEELVYNVDVRAHLRKKGL